jgi:hypothetical protein
LHPLDTLPSTVAKRLPPNFTFGRSRVLTPVPPDHMWVFFRGFPTPSHCGMSHITEKANAGSVSNLSVPTTFLPHPSSPYPSRIFPSMWLKRLWKASAARPPPGGMKDVSFLSFLIHLTEYCGQTPSATLYIRKVPGSNPSAAWPGVGFFQRFPHTITSWYVSYHR